MKNDRPVGVIPILTLVALSLVWGVIQSIRNFFRSGESYRERHHIPSTPKYWSSYEQYLRSDTWSKKRRAVLERAGNQCESEGCNRRAVEIHHVKYPARWGDEPLDYLEAVCRKCHNERHPEKSRREKPDGHMSAEEARRKIDELTKNGDNESHRSERG